MLIWLTSFFWFGLYIVLHYKVSNLIYYFRISSVKKTFNHEQLQNFDVKVMQFL